MVNFYMPVMGTGAKKGDPPSCWGGELYESEEICDEWIKDNARNFTMDEISGNVYSMRIELSD